MPKAYSYIRFSTVEQSKGDSLRRQSQLRDDYLAAHPNLELDTTLNLRDLGISAYDKSNITKGALGQFLKVVETGKIPHGSYLLVESLDRLSRAQVMDALQVFLGILNAGITIVTLTDGMEYSRESTNDNWANLIMSIVIMSRATEESAVKSRRIRASWDSKRANVAEKRLTMRCPYWMKPTAGKTGFELIPERVMVVKRIFQMAKDGIGNSTIVKRLNEEGVPQFSTKSDGWRESYVQKMLRNKAVYGEFQMNLQRDGQMTQEGEPIVDYYPAIMGKPEWLLVNSMRADRKTRGGVSKGKHLSNMFSGLLYCGYCGSPMNIGGYVNKKANGEKRSSKYVACSNGRRGLGCKFIQWNYPDLERQVIEFCKSVDFGSVLGDMGGSSAEVEAAQIQVITLRSQVEVIEGKLSNLMVVLESGEDVPKMVLKRYKELESEVDALKRQKERAEENVERLSAKAAEHSRQQDAIVELLEQLGSLEGAELHDLRIRLSEHIKRAIVKINMYAGGRWHSEDEIKAISDGLKTQGFGAVRIKAHVEGLDVVPNKAAKFMTMWFENGENRTVVSGKVLDGVR